jgi:hypothetical protein
VTETFEVIVAHPSYHRRRQWAEKIGEKLTDLVGGASLYDGTGLWKNGEGIVFFEPHIRVRAYCNGIKASEVFSTLSLLLKECKEDLKQECVLVILDGRTRFLTE